MKATGKALAARVCVFAVLFALVLLLCANMRFSRDDFYYFPFARHGVRSLVQRMTEHYFITNGKLLANGLCAVFLGMGTIPCAVLNIAAITAFAALLSLLSSGGRRMTSAALAGILLTGNYVLSEAVLWIDGSFNYLMPAALLTAYALVLLRADKGSRYAAALALGTLSSLTSELTAVLTLIVTIAVIAGRRRENPAAFSAAAIILTAAGAAFLMLAPGMHGRAAAISSPDAFFESLAADFSLFSQMCWESGGIGLVIIFSALSCAYLMYERGRRALAAAFALIAPIAALTMTGVICSAVCCMIFGIAYFLLLAAYSVILAREGEYIIPVCVVCFAAAFGIICASGIVGYRMLFFPSMLLLFTGLRSLSLSKADGVRLTAVFAAAAVAAAAQTGGMIYANCKNARVWDENRRILDSYDGGAEIRLNSMYDESVFRGGVPLMRNFGADYIRELGIPDGVTVTAPEREYYTVADENGAVASDKAVTRRGDEYMLLGDLADYLGARLTWRLSAAELELDGSVLRFRAEGKTAVTAAFGGRSKRLKHKIREIDDRFYISVDDANRLYGLQLIILKEGQL